MYVASGLLVFALVGLRLPLRALLGAPAAGPRWQQRAAAAAHIGLYALMFIVPLAGWAALADKTATFSLAGIALPLPDANVTRVKLLGKTHETLDNVIIWLAGLHAVAALAHQFVLRDATLIPMLPRRACPPGHSALGFLF